MGLRVWLPLTGTLENQGLSDVGITNSGATINNSGKIGKCYSFDGIDDKIAITNLPNPDNISISMWFKRNANTGTRQFLFTAWKGITLELDGANKITCSVYSNNAQTGYCRTEETYTTSSGWVHICFVFENGAGTKLYINGELNQSSNFTTPIQWNTTTGNIGYFSTYFNGCINDFRLYDHVLSAKEIKELSKGLVLHYPLNRDGFGGDNLIVDTLKDSGESHTTYNIADYNFTESVVSGDTYTVSAKVNASSEKKGICFYHSGGSYQMGAWMPINDTGIYTATFTATDNMASRTAGAGHGYCRVYVSNNASMQGSTPLSGTANVEWIKVEKGSVATPWCPNPADSLYSEMGLDSTTEYDCSGYKYNATRVGTLGYSGDTPRYHVSTVFSGDNAVINCGHDFNVQGIENMSWTCWANCDEWSKGVYQYFVSAQEAGGFLLEVINSNNIVAIINAFHDAEHSTYGYHSAAATPEFDSGWHMLTGTYEPTALKLYIDGVLKKTTNFTTYGVHFNMKANMFIGGEAAGTSFSNPLSGKISDVRVYYTTLPADDVMDLYHKSASVASNGTILTYELEEA